MWDTSKNGLQNEWVDTSSHFNKVDPLSIIHRTPRSVDTNYLRPPDVMADPNIIPESATGLQSEYPAKPTRSSTELTSIDKIILPRQRGTMLSYHGKRIIRLNPRSRLLAHLEQVSLVTPLLAILFHPTATLDPKGYIALDGRLHIDLNLDWVMEDGMKFQANQTLMQFRQTIERFCRHFFSQLNMSAVGNVQEDGESRPRNQGLLPMAPLFEGKMRLAIVDSVVKVLNEDEVYRRNLGSDHGTAYELAFNEMTATVVASDAKDVVISDGDAATVLADAGTVAATKAMLDDVTAKVHQFTLEAEQNKEWL